ncbi:hypothetical protein, partial [Escherichia coli]|uniref:hypothetical protein n=1 Tax=Escherichia coli TaxID=562 RepID=UPI0013B43E70
DAQTRVAQPLPIRPRRAGTRARLHKHDCGRVDVLRRPIQPIRHDMRTRRRLVCRREVIVLVVDLRGRNRQVAVGVDGGRTVDDILG